jgi:hypothetical protein
MLYTRSEVLLLRAVVQRMMSIVCSRRYKVHIDMITYACCLYMLCIYSYHHHQSKVVCTQDDTVTVAVFHDIANSTVTYSRNQEYMRSFLEAARSEFCRLYSTQVHGMRPKLKKFADGVGEQTELQDLQEVYAGFSATVDQLRTVCFPQADDHREELGRSS